MRVLVFARYFFLYPHRFVALLRGACVVIVLSCFLFFRLLRSINPFVACVPFLWGVFTHRVHSINLSVRDLGWVPQSGLRFARATVWCMKIKIMKIKIVLNKLGRSLEGPSKIALRCVTFCRSRGFLSFFSAFLVRYLDHFVCRFRGSAFPFPRHQQCSRSVLCTNNGRVPHRFRCAMP